MGFKILKTFETHEYGTKEWEGYDSWGVCCVRCGEPLDGPSWNPTEQQSDPCVIYGMYSDDYKVLHWTNLEGEWSKDNYDKIPLKFGNDAKHLPDVT